ncbi:hypothetical protein RRG08_061242 [Elysia crispata]|uniref:Uncharacterized protein n=1 Tax=Elysia crispata TaxID=231223 RepID=A0AAE0ZGB6_9GAST|nr:hypothetical protein RRG08_061242 [Elysia crispata]
MDHAEPTHGQWGGGGLISGLISFSCSSSKEISVNLLTLFLPSSPPTRGSRRTIAHRCRITIIRGISACLVFSCSRLHSPEMRRSHNKDRARPAEPAVGHCPSQAATRVIRIHITALRLDRDVCNG